MATTTSISHLLEAGCGGAQRDRVCRSRGGESCAFDGAAIVLMPIADAAHVVHGPITCVANSWESRGVLSSHGDLTHRGLTTAISQLDVVYGSEAKLASAIREAFERFAPKAIFAYATCVTGLVGDDIDAVCRDATAGLGIPVVPVNAPGFVGPKNLGNRIAGEALIHHVIGTGEPTVSTPTDIALIGEYNISGDQWLFEPLLRRAGIRVLSRITGDASFQELTWAHRAKLTALVCSRALVNVARHLESEYGIPYVEVSFFGPTEVARSLRAIAGGLGDAGVLERVERLVTTEESALVDRIAADRATLDGHKAVLYSGGVKTWSMVSALMDLGIEVVAVGTKKASFEDEQKVRAILPDVPLVEDITPKRIRALMAEHGADILVAGGRNQYLAAKEGWAFVDVNQERHTAYAGYEGFVNLAADLASSVRFYGRSLSPRRRVAAQVERTDRACVVDPLRHAPSLGAFIALQGVHRAIPLLHGAQGCNFLGKVLLTKHFREPIALATTKLFTEEVVLGDEGVVTRALGTLESDTDPAVIGVVTSALAEVKGDDVSAALAAHDGTSAVVAVRTAEHDGGLEDGYAAAVEALVGLAREPFDVVARRVTVLAGSHLTPADFVEVREMVESFGLQATIVPDLGALDGSRRGFSGLAVGGVTLGALRALGSARHTLVVGESLIPVAESLERRFGTPYTLVESVGSLAGVDRLMEALSLIAGVPVPGRWRRARAVLVDALRDMQAYAAGRTACVALEPDHIVQVSALLDEMGMDLPLAVVPSLSSAVGGIRAARVVVGDLSDVEAAEIVISNSHGSATARRLGAPLYPLGFPLHTIVGAAHRTTAGYAGARAVAEGIAQLLFDGHTTGDHQ